MGGNEWRFAEDWPPPEAQWSKLYLNSWERLSPKPFTTSSADEFQPPDAFVQMPPTDGEAHVSTTTMMPMFCRRKLASVPGKLIRDVGFFLVPASRTCDQPDPGERRRGQFLRPRVPDSRQPIAPPAAASAASDYSGWMPAAWITSPQRRASSLMKALISVGVPPPGLALSFW